MNPDFLINGVLRSVMGGRRKRSHRATRYLTRGSGSLLSTALSHPTALLTAAGVAWGIFESMQPNADGVGASTPAAGATSGAGMSPASGSVPASSAAMPPLPNVGGVDAASAADADALRIVRLAISAANADGAMNDQERAAIGQQAREAGVAELMERELPVAHKLAEIVSGVTDPAQRATLYVLAFTIVRADEQVTGAERIYLAQLANLLGLDPETVTRLEGDTAGRIDALGDQGQPGG